MCKEADCVMPSLENMQDPQVQDSESACTCTYLIMPTLQLNVYNELPADWPDTTDGISVHFHGFSQRVPINLALILHYVDT